MAHHRFVLVALVAFAFSALAGCSGDGGPTSTTTPTGVSSTPRTDAVGLANPASVYCEEQGGTVEIVDEADGQVGYCNLPDGTRIEEWEFYRANQ